MLKVKIKKLNNEAVVPYAANPFDAGYDLFSAEEISLLPGEFKSIRTGIAIELPKGTEGQVRPRSGLAKNYGVTALNTPGTIDEGYRGEVCVILINHGKEAFEVKKGMKIAQLLVKPTYRVEFEEAESLSESVRGEKGFGSSGL